MTKQEFIQGLMNRPDGMSPLRWVASLGDNRPAQADEWLMEWLSQR